MRLILLVAAAAAVFASPVIAQSSHYVQGYTRSNGTYVAPHYQTNPNSTISDNWSTRPNVNPYTGHVGTVNPNSQPSFGSSYSQPKTCVDSWGNRVPC